VNRSSLTIIRLIAIAAFTASMITLSQVQAQPRWIVPGGAGQTGAFTPCPILRKSFTLESAPSSGTVRVVGLGHFELYLNGTRVGASVINQPWSQYDRTIFWQEFDLGPLLRQGENILGLLLGNSFWRVTAANDTMRFVKTDAMPDFSGGHQYLVWLEATIKQKGGANTTVISDDSWKWKDGPLTFSHIYAGEDYDARRSPAGWNGPGFDDRGWDSVRVVSAPRGKLARYTGPAIQTFEVFQHQKIVSPKSDEYTYVFPQNSSALLRFTVEGEAGKTIRFKPCEYMDSTGHVKFTYTWGTHKDIWHDYTLDGSGAQSHQISFCYVGCQYVGVTGAVPEGSPNPGHLPVIRKLELVHTRAANPVAGMFTCSSELQNRAFHMIDWSIRSNMSYVATDCPHREKNGWQEENWHMARAMSYRFDIQQWFRKIAGDLRDTQLPDGHIPTNCPNYLVGISPHGYWNEAPEWGISGVLLPWHLYEWYGDKAALGLSFESMCRYVNYLTSQAKNGLITSNLGDWCDYGHGKEEGVSQWTPNEVSATAIWALGAKTVAQAAAVLGKPIEAKKYRNLFEAIRRAFQDSLYDAATKTVKNRGSCQAAHSAALYVGLVPEKDRPAVLQAIVDDLRQRNWQQTVGEVLQVCLIRTLADNGRNDVLHQVYSRENRGSYGYMVKQGFTTLSESWDGRPGTPFSMNHFMLGHLMEWHFAYVAGIRQQAGSVGWNRVLIAPNPGSLDSASASFESPRGKVAVRWNQADGRFTMTVTVPAHIQAETVLPDGRRQTLKSGTTTLRANVR
jgi:alpha-L-rhamnosidase